MRPAYDPLRNPEPLIQRVHAYVTYRLGAGPEAEDVTSTTFERAVRYRASYDPRRGEPIAWLIGIASRCVRDSLATRTEAGEPPLEALASGDLAEDTVRRLTLRRALARLGERDRELIALRYGADLSTRRIASLLGGSTNAVDVALHRALARLRAELERGDVLPAVAQPPQDDVRDVRVAG